MFMKKIFNVTLAALVLLMMAVSCSENEEPVEPPVEPPTPELSVTPSSVSATFENGSYAIAITSNVAWTATKDADWLTLNPASGNGDGTVMMIVTENTGAADRTATVTVATETLSETVSVTQATLGTPPYAASTKTWIVGNQVWSDHLNDPACDKTSYDGGVEGGELKADCRNNPGLFYLYSWRYGSDNEETLCPSPWRLPTPDDYVELYETFGGTEDGSNSAEWLEENYMVAWGGAYGGFAHQSMVYIPGQVGYYWSSSMADDGVKGMGLGYMPNGLVDTRMPISPAFGFLLRCVR
jgi:uncharacterized protein (TIGR02145 family)